MQNGLTFVSRYNIFTSLEQLQKSTLEIGQMAKLTDTGEEFQIMGADTTYGYKLANDNRAVKLSEVIREFDTLTELKSHPTIKVGDKCRTWGNELLGDTGAADYVITSADVGGALLKGDVVLDSGLIARQIIRDLSHHEKINHVVVPKGTVDVDTKMVNLSKNPKVFLDGLLLIPGENFTVVNNSKGLIRLTRAFTRDVNIMIVDSLLYSGAEGSSERYNTFTLPKDTTSVLCGLPKLSIRPTLIVNGVYLIFGTHWTIKNAETGEITVGEAYTEDAQCVIIDNNVSGIPDAGTLSGYNHNDFVKMEPNYDEMIANTLKDKYKVGDVIAVATPDLHFRKLSETNDNGIKVSETLYWNYYWRQEQFVAENIAELQKSKRYQLGHIVEVLGNTEKGDGFYHYRKKVETSSSTSVPALDGSNHHWELVANTMGAHKAETGGSLLTMQEMDTKKADKSVTIKGINGLKGQGTLGGDISLEIETISPALIATAAGLDLTVINDFVTGGVKVPASAESVKILKQLIDSIGTGGVMRMLRTGEAFAVSDKLGTLTAGGTSIVVGKTLYDPVLYLDGVRISSDMYTVELVSGLITLKQPYSKTYDCIWVVEDGYPHHIKFAFPTLNLLTASAEVKATIEVGDVIKILGESDADDGDHRLIKCETTKKLNGVEIGVNKWLNEIPNTRIKSLSDKIESNFNKLDSRTLNMIGLEIGSNGIEYIQQPGQKVSGKCYIDQNSLGVCKCINTTTSVNNDGNFVRIDLSYQYGVNNDTVLDGKVTSTHNSVLIASSFLSRNKNIVSAFMEFTIKPGGSLPFGTNSSASSPIPIARIPSEFIPNKTCKIFLLPITTRTGPARSYIIELYVDSSGVISLAGWCGTTLPDQLEQNLYFQTNGTWAINQ